MSEPSDHYELLHYHMVNGHNSFKAGYDSIIARLTDPPQNDLINFLGYCEAWARAIECHHDTEEVTVFPVLNKKMDFSFEIGQHKLIHDFLDEYIKTIQEGRRNPKEFDFDRLKALMEKSKDTLYGHLDAEIEHIQAQKIRDAQVTEEELKGMMDALDKYAKSHGDPFLIVPFMRSHTPQEMKHWPSMPWILRSVIVPYVLAMRHSGYWKYAPYPMS